MTRVICPDCNIDNEIDDHQLAHDLAEGHADRHGHQVKVATEAEA